MIISSADFGERFDWGVSTAAYQIEGAAKKDGKGPSIWDEFTRIKGNIQDGRNGDHSCDFYHLFQTDIDLMRQMHIKNFRLSLSWPRILPEGIGSVNQKGIDFYHRVFDYCLEAGIKPWVTLYHWDLPHQLELRGGWTNRDIISWFQDYIALCVQEFGDKVNHWMILNEPMVFVGAGYFLGVHAPGKKGMKNFLPAVHHATLAQAMGAEVVRSISPGAEIGTTYSCSYVEPYSHKVSDVNAAIRVDALLNRLFIEPALGLGYPTKELTVLNRIEKYMKSGDEDRMKANFDFIGIQNYTREIVKFAPFVPFIKAKLVKAEKRGVKTTLMGWEIFPPCVYKMLKKYDSYDGIKKLIITENGVAFSDTPIAGKVMDESRVNYLKDHIAQVLRAKKEGVKVAGYFVWTLLDNFEWAEGYDPRFGLIYVDFQSQKRIIKSSGEWYKNFLDS
ncbi:GH1 family beta-glucosidase [Fulvivirgaceae bacterium BMA12]|uniref:Beta-glucosidase n=1 Tax=Agaribacillus aureus TaxID=3051825 RepID=A0ABT8L9M3_9BACT|nr:GH1 family beta-glucosidase [Fulvivirgaceae bacterium BMA12]